jgi:hypothetical protein
MDIGFSENTAFSVVYRIFEILRILQTFYHNFMNAAMKQSHSSDVPLSQPESVVLISIFLSVYLRKVNGIPVIPGIAEKGAQILRNKARV